MFTVYSKPACSFCDASKALLELNELPFDVINVDVGQTQIDGERYIPRAEFISAFPDQRTLPLVFAGADRVGGFTELKKYLTKNT